MKDHLKKGEKKVYGRRFDAAYLVRIQPRAKLQIHSTKRGVRGVPRVYCPVLQRFPYDHHVRFA